MKKAIVTGANGFVGSAVCKELSANGTQVIAVVRNEDENVDAIKDLSNLRIVYCDLSNFIGLSDLIPDRDTDVLYHFAWVGSAGVLRGDLNTQINNIKYSCDTVKTCAVLNCKRFVFAASIMEYEIAAQMETDAKPSISSLYCSAKIAADYMARTIAGDLGIEYIRAVISNIYGPGENSPRLINTSIRKLLKGEHCSFSEGNQLYDFIYISDAAKAFVALGNDGKANRTYYIGNQDPKPLKEFLINVRDCVNPEIGIGLGELPSNGVSLTYREFDINAVKRDTGFIPEVSFTEGIRNVIDWLKERKNDEF